MYYLPNISLIIESIEDILSFNLGNYDLINY